MTANEYVASKMGGYDWRGRQPEVTSLYDEYNAQNPPTSSFTSTRGGGVSPAAPSFTPAPGMTSLGSPAGLFAPDASLGWSTGAPGDVFYSPGGGAESSKLTPEMLSADPGAYALLQQSAAGAPNAATGAYKALLGQVPVPETPLTGGGGAVGSGSQHTLPPEVVNRMWR